MSRRGHKYGAVATTIDGIRFASKAEAQRYAELRLLEKAGEIRELTLQPRYELLAWPSHGERTRAVVGHYVADFRYRQGPRGILVIEDVKGYDLPLGRWKRKHFEAQYGIPITVIGRPSRKRRRGPKALHTNGRAQLLACEGGNQ